jgi:serine phosphatase RsbU (regulator of sigma subunit)
LTFLNQDLSERIDSGTFLTLLLLVLGPDGWLEICNAGHHAAILVRRGEVISPQGHSLALGFSPDMQFDIDEILKLESGDVLVAFTDGLVESRNADGDELESSMVSQFIRGLDSWVRENPEELITRLLAEVRHRAADWRRDDVTVVAVSRPR